MLASATTGAIVLATPGSPAGAAATCADGGACVLGDIGPGGGTVVFVKAVGAFSAQRNYPDLSDDCVFYDMCHSFTVSATLTAEQQAALPFDYLEVAPASSQVGKLWAIGQSDVTAASSGLIGAGAANSAAVAAAFPGDDNASTYSLAYAGGGVDDWFLPSLGELSLVLIRQAVDGTQMGALDANLWTSTQCCSSAARALHVATGQLLSVTKNTNGVSALPMRAFSAQAVPTTTTTTTTTTSTTSTSTTSTTSTTMPPTTVDPTTTTATTTAPQPTSTAEPVSTTAAAATTTAVATGSSLTESDVHEMPDQALGVPQQVTSGQQLVVLGSGYVPGTTVDAYVASDPVFLGRGIADSSGSVAITITVPANLTGQHSIVLYVPGLDVGSRQIIQVVSAAPGGALPATGGGLGAIQLAMGVLLAGALILLATRRTPLR